MHVSNFVLTCSCSDVNWKMAAEQTALVRRGRKLYRNETHRTKLLIKVWVWPHGNWPKKWEVLWKSVDWTIQYWNMANKHWLQASVRNKFCASWDVNVCVYVWSVFVQVCTFITTCKSVCPYTHGLRRMHRCVCMRAHFSHYMCVYLWVLTCTHLCMLGKSEVIL